MRFVIEFNLKERVFKIIGDQASNVKKAFESSVEVEFDILDFTQNLLRKTKANGLTNETIKFSWRCYEHIDRIYK